MEEANSIVNRDFNVGDSVEVSLKVFDANKGGSFRLQKFAGTCIAKKRSNTWSASFTVIKLAKQGVIVEKTIMLNSPTLDNVKVVRRGKSRRAKLYYLKSLKGNRSMKIRSAGHQKQA